MGAEDIEQQKRIRDAKQKRLGVLEEQAALMGVDTPPHVRIEIGELRKELEIREAVITSPIAKTQVAEDLGAEGRFVYTATALDQLGKRIDQGFKLFGEWIERVEIHAEERTQQVDSLREIGQRGNRNLILVVGGVLVIFMIVVVVVLLLLVRDITALRLGR